MVSKVVKSYLEVTNLVFEADIASSELLLPFQTVLKIGILLLDVFQPAVGIFETLTQLVDSLLEFDCDHTLQLSIGQLSTETLVLLELLGQEILQLLILSS